MNTACLLCMALALGQLRGLEKGSIGAAEAASANMANAAATQEYEIGLMKKAVKIKPISSSPITAADRKEILASVLLSGLVQRFSKNEVGWIAPTHHHKVVQVVSKDML